MYLVLGLCVRGLKGASYPPERTIFTNLLYRKQIFVQADEAWFVVDRAILLDARNQCARTLCLPPAAHQIACTILRGRTWA